MRIAALLVPLMLAFALAACNDGPGDDIGATVSPLTPEPSPTIDGGEPDATPTSEPQPTPTAPADSTPAATPDGGETAAPSPEGTPAAGPADLGPYQGTSLEQLTCQYDPRSAVVDCSNYGRYSPSPAPTGQDITCSIFLSSDDPVLVFCRSAEPMRSTYYEIQ